jgi:hypothetical protein
VNAVSNVIISWQINIKPQKVAVELWPRTACHFIANVSVELSASTFRVQIRQLGEKVSLTEVFGYPDWGFFPCLFLSCKENARVKPAKTGHGPHSSKFLCSMYFCVVLCIFCVVLRIFVLFYVFLCCSMYCLFCDVLCIVCVYTRSVWKVSVLIFLWTNLKCSTLLRHTSA